MTALLFNPSAAGVGSGDFTHALSRRVGGYTVGILSSDIIGYPSLAPTKPGHADASSVMPGMESDYYNKVWVIPDLIEVRNPPIGVPQEFGIWNACLEQNEILNVVEDDTTGLEVSAEAGDVYKRLQLIRYSITLTPLAPIEIDASYIFNFLIGAGELTFKASRAVVLYEPAEAPLKQVYEWKTDVIRAYDGQEQRVLVRPKPRCNLEYKIVFTSDAKIRTQRANLFTSISSPMVFPLWHEAFYLNAQAPQGTRDLYGDFSLRDFRVGDFLLLVSAKNAHSELVKVFFESDDHIILENVLNARLISGMSIACMRRKPSPEYLASANML
jgi:hypothetical protein